MQIEETRDFEIAEAEREYFESIEYLAERCLESLSELRKSVWNKGMTYDIKRANMATWYVSEILRIEKDRECTK